MDGAGGRLITDATRTVHRVGRLQSAKLLRRAESYRTWRRSTATYACTSRPSSRRRRSTGRACTTSTGSSPGFKTTKLAPKTIKNVLGSLHSIFDYALRKGWVAGEPLPARRQATRPTSSDPDITVFHAGRARRGATSDSGSPCERQVDVGAGLRDPRVAESNCALARDLGVSDSLVSRIRRGLIWTDEASTQNIYGADRPRALPHGGDDRRAPRRAAGAALARRRLAGRGASASAQLRSRRVRHAQVQALEPRGAARRPRRRRARRPAPRRAFQGDDDLVFAHPHTGSRSTARSCSSASSAAAATAGIREQRFHDLRHTFGTRMAAAGVPLRTLQEWMGHRDSKTTQIYADYAPSANEAAIVEAAFTARTAPVRPGALRGGDRAAQRVGRHRAAARELATGGVVAGDPRPRAAAARRVGRRRGAPRRVACAGRARGLGGVSAVPRGVARRGRAALARIRARHRAARPRLRTWLPARRPVLGGDGRPRPGTRARGGRRARRGAGTPARRR